MTAPARGEPARVEPTAGPGTGSRAWPTFLVILAALGLYLLGNASVPLWDRDEPRYAQTSRQMLQSGDWVVPHLYDQVRTAKPPLIYWCQAGAMRLLGDDAFAARLPSAVAMALTLVLLAIVIRRWVSAAHAFWTVLVLATSVLALVSAKVSLTDSVLLLWTTIAQLCVYAIWRGRGSWPVVIVLALAIGLAGITKGPVALGVQAMTLLALGVLALTLKWWPTIGSGSFAEHSRGFPLDDATPGADAVAARSAADISVEPIDGASSGWLSIALKTLVAIGVVALVVAPWMILVERRYPGFLHTAFKHEVQARTTEALEGHRGPPGYYLALIWPMFLPWSLLLPLAMVSGWRRRHLPTVRFALAAALGPWVMFEIVRTKLPHYLLPCFPFLAFLVADAIVEILRDRPQQLITRGFVNAAIVWGIIIAALGCVPWLAALWFRPLPWVAMSVLTVICIAYPLVIIVLLHRARVRQALLGIGLGAMAVTIALFGLYLPRAPFLRLSIDAADALKRDGAIGRDQVTMLDYKEPSLAFYQGGTARENKATVLMSKLLDQSPRWLVVSGEIWNKTTPDVRARVDVVGKFKGLNVADQMRVEQVVVLRQKQ